MRTLFERDLEIGQLRELLDRLPGHGGGQCVISGALGAGKTALLSAAATAAADQGLQVLRARGDEQERSYRFAGALSLFGTTSYGRRGRKAVHAGMDAVGPSAGLASEVAPDDGEFAVLHRLFAWIRDLSAQRGVAVLVDDVEWLDEETLRFLGYLQARISDIPVALIMTTGYEGPSDRPASLDRLLRSSARQLNLTLNGLSLEAAQSMAACHKFEADEHQETVEELWEAADGNPFLLDELFAAGGSRGSPVPERIRALLSRSFDRLADGSHELARAVAILEEALPLPIVAEVAQLPHGVAATAAERLLRAGIFVTADPPQFSSPIFRDAVREELRPGEGWRLHSAAAGSLYARGFEPTAIAPHLLDGLDGPDSWAQEVLIAAADKARSGGAPGIASRYMRRAIEIHGPVQPATDSLVRLGLLEAAAGETTSIGRLQRALAIARNPEERAAAQGALGRILYLYGRHEEAAEAFMAAFRGSGEHPDIALEMNANYMCAVYWLYDERGPAMRELADLVAAIPSARPLSGAHHSLLAVYAVYAALTAGPSDEYAQMALRAWGDGALLRLNGADCLALWHTVTALLACGLSSTAAECAEAAVTAARLSGSALAIAQALSLHAMVARARGDVFTAAKSAAAAVAGINRGWRATMPIPYAILAECRVEQGDLDGAEGLLNVAAEWPSDTPDTRLNSWFYWSRGQLRSARGDTAGAIEDFLRIGSRLHDSLVAPAPLLGPWSSMAGLAAGASGDRALALEVVDRDLDSVSRFGRPDLLGVVMRAHVTTSGPRGDFAEAIAVLEQADAPLELAKALLDQGRIMRLEGRRVDARAPLLRALDIAGRLGATAVAHNAHLELVASGARPRRKALTGPDSLTPSEERVARLAAAGNTNRKIAETLFISRNTVEWHLRHVFQKLGVSTREQLAAALRESHTIR